MHFRKRIVSWFLFLCGSISLLYFIFTLVIGVTLGFSVYYSLFLGMFLILTGVVKDRLYRQNFSKKYRFPLQAFNLLATIVLALFIGIELLIFFNANTKDSAEIDYVIVLGSGLKGDKPTLELAMRLDKAFEYSKHNDRVKLILSGGKGRDELIAEAEAMKRYLLKKGMREEKLILEQKSTSTFENFKLSKELIKNTAYSDKIRLMIITSDFHMFRAKFLAERLGFKAYGTASKSPWYVAPAYYIRESLAVVKSFFADREYGMAS